jgi:site-specific DNA recombinase
MIALYKRVSTTEQAQNGHSLAEQEERMRNYCKAFNWDNIKVYTDGGFSGSNLDRPAMQRLISDIKAHKVEKVIVYKLDRLSRSQKDTLMLIEDSF